jgi:FAD/FMN-containing dehydrogenase
MTNTRRDALKFLAGAAGSLAAAQTGVPRPDADLAEIRKAVRGDVIARSDAGFEDLRRTMTWNPRVAAVETPTAIVRVTSAQDVAATVKIARAHGIKVAIRGGGHHYFGVVLRDDSLLLDLSALSTLDIDAPRRQVSAGPAVKGAALATALAPHGLGFPVGHCSNVALSGFLLNGGLGWNFGEWGASCESIRGIEVITANGEIVRADRQHDADLFWAARGAGPGFFGVVTRYDLAAHELPRASHLYSAAFALESLPAVAAWLPGAIRDVHPYVEVIVTIAPDPEGRTVVGVLAVGFGANGAEARGRVAALAGEVPGASRLGETLDQPTSFTELFGFTDAGFPQIRMSGGSIFTSATFPALLRAVEPHAQRLPAAPSAIMLIGLGGGTAIPRSDGAFSLTGTTLLGAYGFWNAASDDARNVSWIDDVLSAGAAFSRGHYVGEMDVRKPGRASSCFSPEAWRKLARLRERYDPAGVFHSFS